MSNEAGAAKKLPEAETTTITDQQIAAYLKENPDFFLSHQELLADLTLPHESGKAVSLLERQVTLLRERNYSTREQLGSLLENASKNDQFFEITRHLVLALLRAQSVEQLIAAVRETFLTQDNIDACELALGPQFEIAQGTIINHQPDLADAFADVFRLEHTHCGKSDERQLQRLFGADAATIRSTALCPITLDGRPLGILAIASRQSHYFNVNLDTLFLDFIGNVVAACLESRLPR